MSRVSVIRQMVAVSPLALAEVVVVGVMVAVANTAMLAAINHVVNGGEDQPLWGAMFCFALLVKSGLNVLSDHRLIDLSVSLLMRLQRDTFQLVLNAPIRALERVGQQRIVRLMTDDLENIQGGFMLTPFVATQAMVLLGGAAYLAWLSWLLLIGLAGLAGLAVWAQRALLASNHSLMTSFYKAGDDFSEFLYGATRGAKELKLSGFLRERLTREVHMRQVGLESFFKKAAMRETWAETVTQFMLYGVLGGGAFIAPLLVDVGTGVLAQYVVAVLFLVGPLRAVLGVQSSWVEAGASVDRVEAMRNELRSQAESTTPGSPPADWKTLTLDSATFRYEPADLDAGFAVGPVDLTIHRGELVFLVGGNGSGKTTLLKLMMGLYATSQGEVRLDERLLSERLELREIFGGVLADHYLFPWVRGENSSELLQRVALSEQVQVNGEEYSTTRLSKGQRARLALVSTLAESRSFYVFDEWAAEQDPQFREYFYLRLLPELREQGVTVVAATHDDRYFHVADRLVHLERGKVWKVEPLPSRKRS